MICRSLIYKRSSVDGNEPIKETLTLTEHAAGKKR